MKQKLKEAQLAEKRERREQKQQQREDRAMSRKQEKENRQMLKEQQKKDAQKQKEQARENFRQIREQEAEERNLRNQLVQNVEKEERPARPPKKELSRKEEKSEKVQEVPDLLPMSWTASYIPLKQVKNGIIQTSDNRFVKIVEVLPINFLLRSSSEQRSIILSFMSYLKIAPPNIQLKVLSRKADIQEYIDKIHEEAEKETDERCKILQEDYAELIKSLGMKEAITRRFFLIFEYPSRSGSKNPDERDVYLYMRSAVQTAKKYLAMCGNIVLEHENETRFCVEILYQLLNRQTCLTESLDDRIKEVRKYYTEENGPESIRYIPVTELIAPRTIDFRNWNYVVVDGLYYTYLYVQKYRSRVPAGWLSLLINAGEGIDVDVFFFKQDKNRCVERIGRRIRLNRSKIKDTYDSNSDFDSLSESIQAGYYLKRGLSGSEEFYYMSILVTITGHSEQEVEWRSKEMTKLLSSQDIGTGSCIFREEQAFLSSLPFLQIDKNIYEKSKRNVLTSGVAACYPFASYEMSDKDGIMIGVNKANSSLVIIDIFNSLKYKNANIAIFGTSGSGKTFLMQLMALRMRRKNIQVFIIAPDKGHEFARACNNIGGEFIQISPSSSNCINIMEIRPADMEGIKKLLKKFDDEETEKIRNQNDPINGLQPGWIVSTEKVVRERMDDVIKNACAGKYGIGSYDQIQQIFLQIYQAGFEITYVGRLTDAMCASIQDGTANGELDCLLSMNGEEKEIVELYNANMQRIVRTYNKCMAEKSEGDMNSFLQECDWAKQIYDYIWQAKHPRESEDYRKKIEVFLNGMDINVLTSKLKEASLENLEKFRRTLREIYSQNYVPDILWNEKEQIKVLIDSLKEFQENSTDKIRKYQYKLIADYLSEALDRTKNLQ